MLFKLTPLSVWSDNKVREKLGWYYDVMREKKPAKYLICKTIPSKIDIKTSSLEDLWIEHHRLAKLFKSQLMQVESFKLSQLSCEKNNYLELKSEIAHRCLEKCNFCEWKCDVNRLEGKVGVCRLDKTTRVSSWFRHFGEEAPLINTNGSGTIFFTGCMFRCVFCQNWEISQYPLAGEVVEGTKLANIMKDLYEQGAHNINFVGGEPTPNIHTILEGMVYLDVNIPMLWNSDMYASEEALNLLLDVIDIWLPDFKYGNDNCARRLSNIPRYFATVSRNHKIVHDNPSNMIIRHLLLPNHFECCTKPVLEWISKNCKNALVNIMGQYRPDYRVIKNPKIYSDISRGIYQEELEQAFDFAEKLGILYKQVS